MKTKPMILHANLARKSVTKATKQLQAPYREMMEREKRMAALQRAEAGIELVLVVDPALTRELAPDIFELEERKRLWLMIAENASSSGSIGGRDVVSRVVAVLRDCGPDVLSIEDVLPFL